MKRYLSLAAFLTLTVGGGAAIGVFNIPGDWYAGLQKPSFNPPNWLFGPVWTLLYVLIGVAGWRIWRRDRRSVLMKLWWVQLVLNFLWSPVFFGVQSIGGAMAIILALLAVIVAFIATALREDRIVAWLFVPYAIWVAFASLLNGSIYLLN